MKNIDKHQSALNPYKNLSSYIEKDNPYFKGRQKETERLYNYIMQNDIVVLYSESAEGKSSLLNAGLFPLLRKKCYFPVNIVFTQDEFAEQNPDFDKIILGRVIEAMSSKDDKGNIISSPLLPSLQQTINDSENYEWASTLPEVDCDTIPVLSQSAWFVLRFYSIERWGVPYRPILIFDQFEEVFTQASQEWTDSLFKWMAAFYSDNCPQEVFDALYNTYGDDLPSIESSDAVKTVISMRHEYLGELDYWGTQRNLVPGLQNMRFCLKPLTLPAAEDVLNLGFESDPELKERIKTILCDGDYETIDKNSDLPKISPMLLSILCSALFDSKEKKSTLLKNFTKDESNTFDSILIRIYNQIAFKCKIAGTDKAIFEKALIDDEGRRIRVKSNSRLLKSISFDKKYKRPFIKEGIIKTTHINHEEYVELVHDQLAKVIYENRRKSQKQTRSVFTTIAVICACVGIFYATFANNLKSDNIINSPYSEELIQEILIDTISSQDDLSLKYNDHNKTTKIICYQPDSTSTELRLQDFKNLERVLIVKNQNLSNQESLTVSISNSPLLKAIEINDSISEIDLNFPPNNYVDIILNTDIKDIDINSGNCKITINKDSSHYIFFNNALWDLKNKTIQYYNRYSHINWGYKHAPNYIAFPKILNHLDSISYKNEKSKIIYNSNSKLYSKEKRLSLPYNWQISAYKDKYDDGKLDFSKDTLITIIEYGAFQDCRIKEIILPPNLTEIKSAAFQNCKNLSSIYIPDKVKSIYSNAFYGCDKISKLSVSHNGMDDYSWISELKNLKEIELRDLNNGIKPRIKKVDDILLQDSIVISTLNNPYHTYNSCKYNPSDSSYFSKDGILYHRIFEKDTLNNNYKKYRIKNIPNNLVNSIFSFPFEEFNYNGNKPLKTSDYGTIIINSDTIKQLRIPVNTQAIVNITFSSTPSKLEKIILPYPQPYQKYHNKYGKEVKLDLHISLNDTIKSKVILQVPYGCSKNYLEVDEFRKFKTIEESKLLTRELNLISYHMQLARNYFISNNGGEWIINYFDLSLAIAGIIIVGILFFFISYKGWLGMQKGRAVKSIVISLGMMIIAILGFMAFYWLSFIHLDKLNQPMACVIGALGALIALIIVFFSDPFVSLMKRIINRIKNFLNQATGL